MSKSSTRRPGEHSTSAAARERILEATLTVTRLYGYQGTTIARVSKEAGLPTGSVYWHFDNKDKLLASLIDFSFEKWVKSTETLRPRPGETFREHVTRLYIAPQSTRWVGGEDFWRLGVILNVEKSAREQEARDRFILIRQRIRAEFASWFSLTLSPEALDRNPDLPSKLAGFTLALLDGNSIASASDEQTEDFSRMIGLSLIYLAESPEL